MQTIRRSVHGLPAGLMVIATRQDGDGVFGSRGDYYRVVSATGGWVYFPGDEHFHEGEPLLRVKLMRDGRWRILGLTSGAVYRVNRPTVASVSALLAREYVRAVKANEAASVVASGRAI